MNNRTLITLMIMIKTDKIQKIFKDGSELEESSRDSESELKSLKVNFRNV